MKKIKNVKVSVVFESLTKLKQKLKPFVCNDVMINIYGASKKVLQLQKKDAYVWFI